jgi:hypothetical protein
VLLALLAQLTVPLRSAISIAPPDEQGGVSPKVLYIILNPQGFPGGADAMLLGRSRKEFQNTLKDRAGLRLPEDGAKYNTCDPKKKCDRIQVIWYRRTITVKITCNKQEYSETPSFVSSEPRDEDEIDEILLHIFRLVATHNENHP